MPTDELDKIAIVLDLLGEEAAEQVLTKMRPATAAEVRKTLQRVRTTAPSGRRKEEAVAEFDRFYRFARKSGGRQLRIAQGTDVEDDERARNRNWKPFEPSDEPLKDLKKLAPYQLSTCLAEENPRTAAMVLRYLKGQEQARVLQMLPDAQRQKVFVQLSSDAVVPATLVQRMVAAVVGRAVTIDPNPPEQTDPIQMAADILRSVDRPERGPLLQAVETDNEETATQLMERLYVFDDLKTIDARVLQRLLGEVDSQTLATALVGADRELVDKIMSNLAKRARAALNEELEFQQNTSPLVVTEARKAVGRILARIDQEME